jgi:hypothetical protein
MYRRCGGERGVGMIAFYTAVCSGCGVGLGDSWCADCSAREKIASLKAQLTHWQSVAESMAPVYNAAVDWFEAENSIEETITSGGEVSAGQRSFEWKTLDSLRAALKGVK